MKNAIAVLILLLAGCTVHPDTVQPSHVHTLGCGDLPRDGSYMLLRCAS